MVTLDDFNALHAKLKRSLFGTLELACPMCGTRFSVKSASVAVPSVSWSTEFGSVGVLDFDINVKVEHTCPTGTVIEAVMPGA